MVEENISEEFRLKNIDETRSYLIDEINRDELMSKKHKKVCTTLNYSEDFLNLRFYNNWMYFNFCFCLFNWYSNRNREF